MNNLNRSIGIMGALLGLQLTIAIADYSKGDDCYFDDPNNRKEVRIEASTEAIQKHENEQETRRRDNLLKIVNQDSLPARLTRCILDYNGRRVDDIGKDSSTYYGEFGSTTRYMYLTKESPSYYKHQSREEREHRFEDTRDSTLSFGGDFYLFTSFTFNNKYAYLRQEGDSLNLEIGVATSLTYVFPGLKDNKVEVRISKEMDRTNQDYWNHYVQMTNLGVGGDMLEDLEEQFCPYTTQCRDEETAKEQELQYTFFERRCGG
ncbi:MAG: hypothetical protein WCV90_07810 [Candidatus Woesearchaeota archaeon]|jgi:hypothetical protein